MAIKMYAIFSREGVAKMQGNKGKMCAQAGHAYLHAWWDAEELVKHLDMVSQFPDDTCMMERGRLMEVMEDYRRKDDARKIALLVDTDEQLEALYDAYRDYTGAVRVIDCGYTVVEPDTMTCVGIGPLKDEEKGNDLKSLELFLT
jgi:peptidyl-tRNA hydrolase